MSSWKFILLLQNLSLDQPFEFSYLAIVPRYDPRLVELTKKHKTLSTLTSKFTDQFGRRYNPSALIAKKNTPEHVLEIEALVAFRNILAINTIIQSWQSFLLRGQAVFSPTYSNYFDFYPIAPDRYYEDLITNSPSLRGLDESKNFRGQTSPELATLSCRKSYSEQIVEVLLTKWKERYVKRRKQTWKTIVVFRSLEMAYNAARMPFQNYSSIYDYGSAISLWVSAFEVLVHPKTGKADLNKVINLIGCYPFNRLNLRHRKYRMVYKNKTKSINLAQKLYSQIYQSRNSFIHGNPILMKDLMAFGKEKRYGLNLYAPLLYKIALYCYISNTFGRKKVMGLS